MFRATTRALVPVPVLALAGAVLLAPVAPAAAAPTRNCAYVPTGADWASGQDLDNDGFTDLVQGIPAASVSGRAQAGVVDVHFGPGGDSSRAGAHQRLSENSLAGLPAAQAGDRFGASWDTVDANGDQCQDLVVGAPGADGGRGAVLILLGSENGLSTTGAIRLVGQTRGEHFGADVAVSSLGSSTAVSLFVSAPDRAVAGHPAAGAVDHFRFAGAGAPSLIQRITEQTPGIPGVAEPYDHFGSVLAEGAIAFGSPYEDVGRAKDAGSVTAPYFSGDRLVQGARTFSQASPGVGGAPETGDHFGAAITFGSQLVVGAPGEDFSGLRDAGAVQVIADLGTSPGRTITQNTPEVPGVAEAGDRFGAAVSNADVLSAHDGLYFYYAVGAPGESIGSIAGAGTVTFVGFPRTDQDLERHIYQLGAHGIPGAPHSGDHFGATLRSASWSYHPEDLGSDGDHAVLGDDLVIGVPGADVRGARDAGELAVLQLFSGHQPAPGIYFDTAGPRAGEQYGAAG